MGTSKMANRVALVLIFAAVATLAMPRTTKPVELVVTEHVEDSKCCETCTGDKNKYFSIADDSGPWLCGETCIRDSFYWIFHVFEKNLTKAANQTVSVCADNGYTKYNSTVTHGGGGLYCTLDLYECAAGSGSCPHPGSM